MATPRVAASLAALVGASGEALDAGVLHRPSSTSRPLFHKPRARLLDVVGSPGCNRAGIAPLPAAPIWPPAPHVQASIA